MKLQIDKLGKVAVTVEEDYWSLNKDYDKLTIVQKEDAFGTFISRKPVPAGTVLTDRNYWIPFSSVKEDIVIHFNEFVASLTAAMQETKEYTDNTISQGISDITAIKNEAISIITYIANNGIDSSVLAPNSITTDKIQNGAVTNSKLADNSIDVSKLAAGTIDGSKLKDNSIPGSKLADGAIGAVDIQDNTLNGSKLIDNSIDGSKIVNNAITTDKIKDNSIDGSKIADGTIQTLDIKDNSISGSKLANSSITTNQIANNAITNDKIANNTITGEKFADDTIPGEKIVTNSIDGSKLARNSVDGSYIIAGTLSGDKIKNESIDGNQLDDDSIETRHIKSNTITASKIQDNAISSDKIRPGSLTNENFAQNAITNSKIEDEAITNDKIADNTIASSKIEDGAITEDKIAPNSIGGTSIANGAITNSHLQDDSIANNNIANNTLTGDKFIGNISGNKIQDNSIPGSKLANGAIVDTHLTQNSITGNKIMDNSISGDKIVDDAITEDKINNLAITTSKINNAAVTEDKIAQAAVTSGKIANAAVTENKLDDDSVTTDKIASGAVTTDKIVDGAITTSKIQNNTITGDKIGQGEIKSTNIASNAVQSNHIGNNAVNADKIANDAITTNKILDNAVITDKINNGAVTTDKINNSAVTEDKIAAEAVTTAKINDNAVTTSKIVDANITTDKIANNAVTTAKIVDEAITTAKISDDNITTAKIANNAVTEDKILDSAIVTSKIADSAVTTDKIADNNVTTDKIAASNVTTVKIADGAITEEKIADGAITTDKIADDAITELQTIMDAEPTEDSIKPVMSGGVYDALEEKANIDGYYETLGAGTATNLKGDSVQEGTFKYRPTAGALDIESGSIPDGGAYVENIKGNTVPWNQMLNPDDWVDMGLPSGTLWCKKNIDITQTNGLAASPFQYECSFFSWGNTDGHNPISSSAFDYDFGNVNSASPYYEGQPYGETTGSTLVSDITLPNDAANVNIGGTIGMPSNAQFVELIDNCTFMQADGVTPISSTTKNKLVTVEGVRGIFLKSNINGNMLFFACSGIGTGTQWQNRGTYGNYWSASFGSERLAFGLNFGSSGVNPQGSGSSYVGRAIRPVFTPSTTPIDGKDSHKFAVTKDTISDLTLIYGINNEPSSVDTFKSDFKNWFGRPMGAEPYDEGSLIPVTMSALKTVGFNQYNPTTGLVKAIIGKEYQITGTYTKLWESEESSVAFTAYTYGDAVSNDTYYTNNNNHYISSRIISAYDNTTTYDVDSYCVYSNSVYKSNVAIATAEDFDSTKWDLIADVAAMVTEGIFVPMDITPDSSGKFTPTKYYLHVEGGNDSNTCVHLVHSGAHDGEYEPYWDSQVNVPITQLTGKLNGSGESVVVFPDGMKRAGDVYDEIKIEGGVVKAIKRVGSVNLGSLMWSKRGNIAFSSNDIYAMKSGFETKLSNILCAIYPRTKNSAATRVNQLPDKTISTRPQYKSLHVRDSSFNLDTTAFKNAMQGVLLYYELATPQVYIIDNFKLPLVYNVDDYGTEEVINAENTHGVAPTLGIRYGLNAADFVRNSPKNFITKESMEKFLDRLGTAMNGVWSMTWDASNNRYDYSFVANAQSDTQDDDNVEPDEEEPVEEGA